MNPYGDLHSADVTAPDFQSPLPCSATGPCDGSHNPPLISLPSLPVVQTVHISPQISSNDGDQSLVQSPNLGRLTFPLPGSDPGFGLTSGSLSSLVPVSPQTPQQTPENAPSPHSASASESCRVAIPSPDLRPSPLPSPCSEDTCPDLECSICFSQFNNVFRCPKMLHCNHTFCLECLARINVKSAEPSAIQCPLCRRLTPLPDLGLPRLTTDSDVLSYLPAAMQRVYSIRFLRNKGKLEIKRSAQSCRHWGQRSLVSLRSGNRSLDVGLPSPPVGGRGNLGDRGGALFQLTGRPACRAFLLTSVVMMMVVLTAIVIFLLTYNKGSE